MQQHIILLLLASSGVLLFQNVAAFQARSSSGRVLSNVKLAEDVKSKLRTQFELASSERDFKLKAEESDESPAMLSESSGSAAGQKNGLYIFGLNLFDPQDLLTIFFSGVIAYTTGDMLLYYIMKFLPF